MRLTDIELLTALKKEFDALRDDLQAVERARVYANSTFTSVALRYGSSSGGCNISAAGAQAIFDGAKELLEKRIELVRTRLTMVGVTDFGDKL